MIKSPDEVRLIFGLLGDTMYGSVTEGATPGVVLGFCPSTVTEAIIWRVQITYKIENN